MQTEESNVQKVEQAMQVDITLEDKSLQTSPRQDLQAENHNILATDVVPKVASDLMSNIVTNLPIKIDTETQETTTETIKTAEQVSQTSPRNEYENVNTEPYEIHIQTSFVIPEDANISKDKSHIQNSPFVTEIQKSFIIDEAQPSLVHELESTNDQKNKKKKSKKKKPTKSNPENGSEKLNKPIDESNVEKSREEDTTPTFATLKITKTTVFETSNLISRERHPYDPLVTVEKEVISEGISKSPGNRAI